MEAISDVKDKFRGGRVKNVIEKQEEAFISLMIRENYRKVVKLNFLSNRRKCP